MRPLALALLLAALPADDRDLPRYRDAQEHERAYERIEKRGR